MMMSTPVRALYSNPVQGAPSISYNLFDGRTECGARCGPVLARCDRQQNRPSLLLQCPGGLQSQDRSPGSASQLSSSTFQTEASSARTRDTHALPTSGEPPRNSYDWLAVDK